MKELNAILEKLQDKSIDITEATPMREMEELISQARTAIISLMKSSVPSVEKLLPIAYKFYEKMTTANKDIAADFLAQACRKEMLRRIDG